MHIVLYKLVHGIFTIKVPFFEHKTQKLCFYYLPNIKFTWNKFKWKVLDNSNYDNLHGDMAIFHMHM
jgi:hypothetical protein